MAAAVGVERPVVMEPGPGPGPAEPGSGPIGPGSTEIEQAMKTEAEAEENALEEAARQAARTRALAAGVEAPSCSPHGPPARAARGAAMAGARHRRLLRSRSQ